MLPKLTQIQRAMVFVNTAKKMNVNFANDLRFFVLISDWN